MEKNFCFVCSGKLEKQAGEGTQWQCEQCGRRHFLNPVAAVEAILIAPDGKILISERARDPWKGSYDLPGGFMDVGETLEQGMRRELHEELGLSEDDYEALEYYQSYPSVYLWEGQQYPVLDVQFKIRLKRTDITSADDVAAVKFIDPADYPSYELSQPHYVKIFEQLCAERQAQA